MAQKHVVSAIVAAQKRLAQVSVSVMTGIRTANRFYNAITGLDKVVRKQAIADKCRERLQQSYARFEKICAEQPKLEQEFQHEQTKVHSLIEQYRRSNPTASVTEILQTEISLRSEFQRHPIVLRKESAKAEFDTSLQQVKDTIHEFQGALMVVNEVESTWSKARNTLTAYVTISSIGFALLSFIIHSRRTASIAETVSESMMQKFLALERQKPLTKSSSTSTSAVTTHVHNADTSTATNTDEPGTADITSPLASIADVACDTNSDDSVGGAGELTSDETHSVNSGDTIITTDPNADSASDAIEGVHGDNSTTTLDTTGTTGKPDSTGTNGNDVGINYSDVRINDSDGEVGLLGGDRPGFPAVDFVAIFVYIALAAFINN